MKRNQRTYLGRGRVFRDDRTGAVLVDRSSIRGESDIGDDVGEDFGDEDVGDDDFGDEDVGDDDFGDEDVGDDDVGDEDVGDEVGRRRRRRPGRRPGRRGPRAGGLRRRQEKKLVNQGVGTAVTATFNASGAGPGMAVARPQHDFHATDIRATGPAGSYITAIRFADQTVWSGRVPVALLGGTTTIKDVITNASIKGGLDIQVDVEAGGAGIIDVVFTGRKARYC